MEPLKALSNPREPLSAFPPHRRRHLNSDTFSTLLRFLSHNPHSGGDNYELGRKCEVCVDANGITVMESDMLTFSGDASCANVVNMAESANGDRMETNEVDLGSETALLEKGSASNELEQASEMCADTYGTGNMESEMLSTDGDGSYSKAMNVVQSVHEDRMEADELNTLKWISRELGEETGFEILNSLEETNPENCVVSLTTIDESQGFEIVNSFEETNPESYVVSLTKTDGSRNSLVGGCGQGLLCKDSEIVVHTDVDKEDYGCKLTKGLHLSLDMGETAKSPMLDNDEKVKNSVRESSESHQLDLENSLSKFSLANYPICVAVDEEIEEGEISGDLVMDDELIDFLNEEEQTSGPFVNRELIMNQNQKGTSEVENKYDKVFGITVDKIGKGVESNVRASDVSYLREIISYQNLVDSATKCQGGLSTDKDAGVEKKRKRARMTQEQRAAKKKRERIKSAEKNRHVKRLKIQPVLKPKTIQYCRHYLQGRCREGDKCKFSHDTTPLTKSKPCCFFARQNCWNTDCQYDHQLSKYPCNNILSSGVCKRTNCLFSHEVQVEEGSPTVVNASNSEAKSSSLAWVTNLEKKSSSHNYYNQKDDSKTVSSAVLSQKVAESRLGAAASAPKGISKLLFGKSPLGKESKLVQAGTSSKIYGNVQNNLRVPNYNTNNMVSNLNGTSKVLGCNEPKGLSFLSFGEDPTHTTSSSKQVENLKLTNTTSENKSEIPKRTPFMPPRGINFLSFGQSSTANNSSNTVTPSVENGASSSSREGEIGQNLTGQLGKGASSSALKALLTNGTSSAQKALQSSLAFAAKYESSIIV